MKKKYFKPEADKISFNYRDQVVAASSVGGSGDNGGNGYEEWTEAIIGIGSNDCNGLSFLFNIFGFC